MLLIFIIVLLTVHCSLPAPIKKNDNDYAVNTLIKYGYLNDNYRNSENVQNYIKEAVIRYQEFFGTEMNGNIDDELMKIMYSPRCGIPDVLNYRAITSWPKSSITYSIRKESNKLDPHVVSRTIRSAFDIWAKYVDLKFIETTRQSDINIHFLTGDHGDGSNFDGPGNVLGHAQFPPFGLAHFDDDEDWDISINLYKVVAHEIGHLLGLDHSMVKGALMYPYYNPISDFKEQLHQDDINGIRSLYGEIREKCSTVTSIISLAGTTTVFLGAHYYQKGNTEKITNKWPIKINNMNKARVSQYEDTLLFFHGLNYTKVENDETKQGVIKTQFGISGPVDAVVNINGNLYFFKGDQYWVFNPTKYPRIAKSYPRPVSDFKFPTDLDTAYYIPNRKMFVAVKNSKAYMYNFMTKSITTTEFEKIICIET